MHTNYRLPSLSGFCHFDLVLFMVLSPDTPVMSCFYVSARLWVCLLSVCLVSCWSVVFGSRHLCFEFRFRIEVRKLGVSLSMFCLVVWACGLEFAQLCALLSTCVLWCCTQFVFLSAGFCLLLFWFSFIINKALFCSIESSSHPSTQTWHSHSIIDHKTYNQSLIGKIWCNKTVKLELKNKQTWR